jgi:transcriptional regulator of heat shock response
MAQKKISKKQQLANAKKKLELQKAREFVKSKFKDIESRKVDYKKLSTVEKKIFNALEQRANRFTYKNKFLPNPFGVLNQLRANKPGGKGTIPFGVTDLTNLFPNEQVLRNLLNTPATVDFESWKEHLGGNKFKKYRTKNGKLLDIVTRLKTYQKKGFKIIVKTLDIRDKQGNIIKKGEEKINNDAFVALKNFEQDKQDEFWDDREDELETIEIIYKKILIDPENETITIDLNKAVATPKGGTY